MDGLYGIFVFIHTNRRIMEKNFNVLVINPVTDEVIYCVNVRSLIEINPEQNASEYKITTNWEECEDGGHVVEITAANKEMRNILAVRVAEELTEDAFYSAFDEYNSLSVSTPEMEADIEKKFGVNIDSIKASIRYQILEGLGVFE